MLRVHFSLEYWLLNEVSFALKGRAKTNEPCITIKIIVKGECTSGEIFLSYYESALTGLKKTVLSSFLIFLVIQPDHSQKNHE